MKAVLLVLAVISMIVLGFTISGCDLGCACYGGCEELAFDDPLRQLDIKVGDQKIIYLDKFWHIESHCDSDIGNPAFESVSTDTMILGAAFQPEIYALELRANGVGETIVNLRVSIQSEQRIYREYSFPVQITQ